MSISSLTNRNIYTGNNSNSVYNYTFKLFQAADIRVVVYNTATPAVATILVLGVDYTVQGLGTRTGGTITLINSGQAWLTSGNLTTGYQILLRRVLSLVQNTDIKNQGAYFPELHENQFDMFCMQFQQLYDDIQRSARFHELYTASLFNPYLPDALVGAVGATLVVGSDGASWGVGPTVSQITGATAASAASAAAAAASAVTAAGSVTAAAASATAANTSALAAAASAAAALYQWGGTSTNSTNAYSITPATTLVAYITGIRFAFIANFTNTGAATLNVSGLGAKAITTLDGSTALTAAQLVSGSLYSASYDGVSFRIHEIVSIANNSITNAKLAQMAANTIKGNNTTSTANAADLTPAQVVSILQPSFLPSNAVQFLSGSGTYFVSQYFYCSAFTITPLVGATYTNNSKTFTVVWAANGLLLATSTGAPTTSGTLTKSTGTGDASVTFTSARSPIEIEVAMVGAGGGGGGGNSSGAATGGTAGSNATFGGILTANGGTGGGYADGGAGGVVGTISAPAIPLVNVKGGGGGCGVIADPAGTYGYVGSGGNSALGGGAPSSSGSNSVAGSANTGGGGAGGAAGQPGGFSGGSGGGAGNYLVAIIPYPVLTGYAYSVPGSAAGGAASGGTSVAGSASGSGAIYIKERWQ